MFIAHLAVIFLGVTGDNAEAVQKQIAPVLRAAHVKRVLASEAEIVALTHHTRESRDIVKHLAADGVIAGELVTSGRQSSLRFVIYGREGIRRSFNETPLVNGKLTREDLEVFTTNLDGDVGELSGQKPVAAAPAARGPRQRTATPAPVATAVVSDVDDAPPGLASGSARPTPAQAVVHDDEPIAGETTTLTATAPTARRDHSVVHADVGVGIASRGYAPGPSKVTGYTSSPVGQIRFAAGFEPTKHLMLDVLAERTLQMSTPLADGMAPTTISRWEVAAGYTLHGPIDVTPVVGLGDRGFAVQSTDATRSPDSNYRYAVLGLRFAKAVGTHVTLRTNVAFEPIIGGSDPTEMAVPSKRWGLGVGAAIDVHPVSHVYARVGFDWQRFAWSWDAGSAVDSYPTGLVALGAEY